MLAESLSYLFHSISCPGYVKQLGMLQEIIAIEARYNRCKEAWQEHLTKCKTTILEQAQKLKNRDRIIVLGAGSLHDVPLQELSELFKEVHLVDIFFLQSSISKIKTFENVDFHELDITGVLRAASKLKQSSINKLDQLAAQRPKDFLQDENIDMVISLNLVSQLPIAIKSYFENKEISSSILKPFYQNLIKNHLGYLRAFASKGSKILVITDTERKLFGNQAISESSLEDLEESIFNGFDLINEWQWQLAPQGELSNNYSLELKVKSFIV